MVTKSADETAIREYLLGVLPEPLWDEIEQKLLVDDRFAETVELIEDELVDEFLEGGLARSERTAFENHFLQAPEHRRKLDFARLLRSHLRTGHESARTPSSWFYFASSYRTFSVGFACLLIFAVGLATYTLKLRRELAVELAKSQNAENALLASQIQARERIAELEKQLNENQATLAANRASLVLNLLAPVTRDLGSVPSIDCIPGAISIEVRIPLVEIRQDHLPTSLATLGAVSSYSATLHGPGGKELWFQTNIRPIRIHFAEQLAFAIPNSLACHQRYSLLITGKRDHLGREYAFTIR